MLSRETEFVLENALQIAKSGRHEFVTPEHLLISLLGDTDARTVIENCGGDIKTLTRELEDHIHTHVPKRNPPSSQQTTPALVVDDSLPSPQLTMAFRRIVQRAVVQVQSSGQNQVKPGNLIVAFFDEIESFATYFLKNQNITRYDVINFISHGTKKSLSASKPLHDSSHSEDATHSGKRKSDTSALQRFSVNLVEKALSGRIDPLVGRHDILDRMVQVLARRSKNNPLLIGDPGVGKTALVEGLALRIAQNEIHSELQSARIYALDMGLLLAGTKFRGDFEERLLDVIREIQEIPGAVLFIDEIHTLVGAGGTQGGSMDASNLLKPALANGEISCIGSSTFKDYRTHFEKDRALARRFQTIEVSEPSIEESIKILNGLRKSYEDFHKVHFTQSAIKAAVELSAKHITSRCLPDKAIDAMDEAGARARVSAKNRGRRVISVAEIENTIAQMARIPIGSVTTDDQSRLQNLSSHLKLLVFGQDSAVDQLALAIKLSRAGLGHSHKPVGSFLFAGPTGVGKTEVARQLAKVLAVEFVRFDMSEYMEKHAVSRLVGAPPGYVGYDDGGLLTEAIRKTPYCVLLLDEIEKAHTDLLNILLQVMDNGTLTDTNGRTSYFRNVIIVMTTNAGARDLSKSEIGIAPGPTSARFTEAIKQIFSPEFLNRLDATVPFNHLSEEVILQVVGKFVMELEAQLLHKNVELTVTPSARRWLVTKGYDKSYGARPMARAIQDFVKKPLVDQILFGDLAQGGHVRVDAHPTKDELTLEFKSNPGTKVKESSKNQKRNPRRVLI